MTVSVKPRATPRFPLEGRVGLSWQDRSGIYKVTQAKAIDACELGLQIESIEQVEKGTVVTVRPEKYAISLPASVRYCRRQGPRFRLGLEFNSGSRLRPLTPQPTA